MGQGHEPRPFRPHLISTSRSAARRPTWTPFVRSPRPRGRPTGIVPTIWVAKPSDRRRAGCPPAVLSRTAPSHNRATRGRAEDSWGPAYANRTFYSPRLRPSFRRSGGLHFAADARGSAKGGLRPVGRGWSHQARAAPPPSRENPEASDRSAGALASHLASERLFGRRWDGRIVVGVHQSATKMCSKPSTGWAVSLVGCARSGIWGAPAYREVLRQLARERSEKDQRCWAPREGQRCGRGRAGRLPDTQRRARALRS